MMLLMLRMSTIQHEAQYFSAVLIAEPCTSEDVMHVAGNV